MNTLIIVAQDISEGELGWLVNGKLVWSESFSGAPDTYLAHVQRALGARGLGKKDIESVLVATGPGSFTASRVSLTLANALGFAQNIPLYGVPNPGHLSLAEWVSGISLEDRVPQPVLQPLYDKPPNITMPKPPSG